MVATTINQKAARRDDARTWSEESEWRDQMTIRRSASLPEARYDDAAYYPCGAVRAAWAEPVYPPTTQNAEPALYVSRPTCQYAPTPRYAYMFIYLILVYKAVTYS